MVHAALVWLCPAAASVFLGGCGAVPEGQSRAEQEGNVFPGNLSLSLETPSAVLEVLSPGLVSDAVTALSCHTAI